MGLMSQCLVSSEGFKVTPAGVPGEGAVGGFSSPPKEAEGILLLVTTEFAPRHRECGRAGRRVHDGRACRDELCCRRNDALRMAQTI